VEYTVDLGDHRTRVVQFGEASGPLVVLVHAGLLDAGTRRRLTRRLAGRRMIAYDLRGHGAARSAPAIAHPTLPAVDGGLSAGRISGRRIAIGAHKAIDVEKELPG
jgi:pimeloyl-ACP methyl ester carboxylesterase